MLLTGAYRHFSFIGDLTIRRAGSSRLRLTGRLESRHPKDAGTLALWAWEEPSCRSLRYPDHLGGRLLTWPVIPLPYST